MEQASVILEKLVSYKTTADNPQEVRDAYAYIESLFGGLAVEVKYFEHEGKVSQLIYAKGSDWQKPKLLLNGHLDVVPTSKESDFKMRVEGDHAYGRGTADMKGGLVAMIMACQAIAKDNSQTSWGLLISADEEIGGKHGVGYIVESEGLRPEFVLVGDGPRTERFSITTKEKGGVWVELTATGKNAHGARPWLGENALDKVTEAIEAVKQLVGTIEPDAWKSTTNLAIVDTPNVTPNMVPGSARAVIDIRFTEALAKSPEELLEKVRGIVPGIEVKALTRVDMLHTNEAHPNVLILQKTFSEIVGVDAPFSFGHGASDARYFSASGMPAVLVGVIGANWHAEDEWVSVSSIETLGRVIEAFMKKIL